MVEDRVDGLALSAKGWDVALRRKAYSLAVSHRVRCHIKKN